MTLRSAQRKVRKFILEVLPTIEGDTATLQITKNLSFNYIRMNGGWKLIQPN